MSENYLAVLWNYFLSNFFYSRTGANCVFRTASSFITLLGYSILPFAYTHTLSLLCALLLVALSPQLLRGGCDLSSHEALLSPCAVVQETILV
jgi:hypothetical protein